MRVILELARIMLLLLIGGALLSQLELLLLEWIKDEVHAHAGLYLGAANLVLLFLLYRNRWQFSGWYRKGSVRLPPAVTRSLAVFSLILIGIAAVL